jgi:uncharacterized protein (TIGR03067 family)
VWEQVAHEADGIANPPDEFSSPGVLTTFTGDHFAVRGADGALLLEGHFTLDASASPGHITWTDSIGPDAGKPLPAIYTLEDDRFIFIAADAGAARPTQFKTVPGLTMRSLVRR